MAQVTLRERAASLLRSARRRRKLLRRWGQSVLELVEGVTAVVSPSSEDGAGVTDREAAAVVRAAADEFAEGTWALLAELRLVSVGSIEAAEADPPPPPPPPGLPVAGPTLLRSR